jgi:hypothetical protein
VGGSLRRPAPTHLSLEAGRERHSPLVVVPGKPSSRPWFGRRHLTRPRSPAGRKGYVRAVPRARCCATSMETDSSEASYWERCGDSGHWSCPSFEVAGPWASFPWTSSRGLDNGFSTEKWIGGGAAGLTTCSASPLRPVGQAIALWSQYQRTPTRHGGHRPANASAITSSGNREREHGEVGAASADGAAR